MCSKCEIGHRYLHVLSQYEKILIIDCLTFKLYSPQIDYNPHCPHLTFLSDDSRKKIAFDVIINEIYCPLLGYE